MNMMMLPTNLNLKTKNFPADPRFSIVTLGHLVFIPLNSKVFFSHVVTCEILFPGLIALPKMMMIDDYWE